MKVLKPSQTGKGGVRAESAAPAYGLSIPTPVLAIFFSAFAIYLCWYCWRYLPFYPFMWKVLKETWAQNAVFIFPSFPGFLYNWGWNLLALAVLGVFEVASWTTGRKAILWGTGRKLAGLAGILLPLAIGNGVLGTAVLGLGLVGLIGWKVIGTVLAAPFLSAIARFIRFRRQREAAGNPLALPSLPVFNLTEKFMLAFILYICVYNTFSAIQPEWFYDSLVYHLAFPSRWVVEHRICHLPETFISSYPLLQQMQYLVFVSLGIDGAARLLHYTNGIEAMAATYLVARPILGRTGALVASAVFISLPPIRFLAYTTMVELGLTRFSILAIFAFMMANGLLQKDEGNPLPRRGWIFLSAWLLGLAQGTKFIGIYISTIIIGTLLVDAWRGRYNARKTLGDISILIGWASVWTLPWLFKNVLFTGNPVFPMLGRIFPTDAWDENINKRWMKDNTRYGTGRGSIFNWLMMPIKVSVGTPDFGTFSLNPFFILFLPVLLFIRGIPPAIRFLACATAAYFLIWSMSSQQTRFFMPIGPVAAVATAFVIHQAFKGRTVLLALSWAAAGWIFMDSFMGEAQNRLTTRTLIPYTTGYITRPEFLGQGLQYYRAADLANKLVGKNNRILFLGGDESYYVKSRMICASIYDKSAVGEMAKLASSPAELRRIFRKKRITHIIYNEPRAIEYIGYGIFDWGTGPQKVFTEFLSQYGSLVYLNDGVYLYEVTGKPLPVAERKTGRPLCFYSLDSVIKLRTLISKADDLISQQKFADGLLMAQEMVKLAPDSVAGISYRGYLRERLGYTAEAIRDYRDSIRLGYPPITAYYNLGLLYEKGRQYKDAFEVYQQGIRVEKNFDAMNERTAELAFYFGQNELSMGLFTALARKYPDKPIFAARVDELKKRLMASRLRQ
jgi:tetratricopeptide (TPR) repeat protein